MKINIVKNRYLNTLLMLMLFSASIHLVCIAFNVVLTGNIYLLNYFTIVGLDTFIPADLNTLAGNIAAAVFTVALYGIIFIWNSKSVR